MRPLCCAAYLLGVYTRPAKMLSMMRLVFDQTQPPQPQPASERDLADHDLEYLLSYLSHLRGESYEIIARPDEDERGGVAPDYTVREVNSGGVIAVELSLLMKEDLQAAAASLIKQGANVIIIGPQTINPQEIAGGLTRAVERKLSRGQLLAVQADERILLLRNRLIATERTFLRAGISFDGIDTRGVDHAYLIASSRLIQLW